MAKIKLMIDSLLFIRGIIGDSKSQATIKQFINRFLLSFVFCIYIINLNSVSKACSLTLTSKNNMEFVNNQVYIYFIPTQNKSNKDRPRGMPGENSNTERNAYRTDNCFCIRLNACILNTYDKERIGLVKLLTKITLEYILKITISNGILLNLWDIRLQRAISERCKMYFISFALFAFIPISEV